MECVATERAEVLKVACRLPLSVAVPSVVLPSLKVTEPVGEPAPGAINVTVAVKVTDWPETDGLAELLTDVVVLALLTETEAVPVLLLSVPVTVWPDALDGVHVAAVQEPSGAIVNVAAEVTSPRLLLN